MTFVSTRDIPDNCTSFKLSFNALTFFYIYKYVEKPASVSIQPLHNTNPLKEEEELQLQCNINSVAPAQNLYVRWYHGNNTLEPLIQGRTIEC